MRHLSVALLSALALALTLCGWAWTSSVTADARNSTPTSESTLPMPDVLILVLVSKDFDAVSFVYPRSVEHSKAERHLANLLHETGWTADQIKIDEANMADGSITTSVEFVALGTVNTESGAFPLEPMIKAFKDQKHLRIEFMLSVPFDFRGLEQFENQYVNIALQRGTNAYEYDVHIKDASFRTLGLPLRQPASQPADKGGPRAWNPLAYLCLILLLGLLSAALVYFLIKRSTVTDTRGEC